VSVVLEERIDQPKDTWPSFVIVRNPEADSRLPYLLRLLLGGSLVMKARDTWPSSARIYGIPTVSRWDYCSDQRVLGNAGSLRDRGTPQWSPVIRQASPRGASGLSTPVVFSFSTGDDSRLASVHHF
jgi:hypothetical protein